MKKYICILISAATLVACEQKTETAAPVASPAETTENNTTMAMPPTPGMAAEHGPDIGDTPSANETNTPNP